MRRDIVFLCVFCQSRCQRNRQTLAADISYTGCQTGTKFGTLIEGALLYINAKIGELRPRDVPLACQNTEGCKNYFVTLFVYVILPIAVKFGTMRGIGP